MLLWLWEFFPTVLGVILGEKASSLLFNINDNKVINNTPCD